MSQSDSRLDPGRAAGGDVGRDQRDAEQHQRDAQVASGIGGTDSKQHAGQHPRHGQRPDQTDREPEQNRFIRSDQYSYIQKGVPALAFKFGYEFGSPEETMRKNWVRDIYHKPNDDTSQPVDKEAAALFNRVIMGLLQSVANDAARPAWNKDSFFRRFSK